MTAVLDKPTWIEQHRRVYDSECCSPTVFADAGTQDKSIKIAIKANTKGGVQYADIGDGINIAYP